MNPLFAAPAVCNTGPLVALAWVEMACLDGMIQGGYHIGPNLFAACLSAAGEQE